MSKVTTTKQLWIISAAVTIGILLIDQWSKIWVKTHMVIGQEFVVFDWFRIHFLENPGMAFGMQFGGDYGKLALTTFRILAVGGIFWYIQKVIKSGTASKLFVVCLSMIWVGAIGNIIDSVFYGELFSESTRFQLATFLPVEGGYSSWMHGKVVDMLYFPMYSGVLPDWIPFWGGDYFVFFRPVFNIADAAISLGVAGLILFQKRFFPKDA